LTEVKGIAKAILAGVTAFVSSLLAAISTGESFGQIDAKTWLAATLAGVVGLGLVYSVPNGKPAAAPAVPAAPPPPAP
jgi:hypothetical protein